MYPVIRIIILVPWERRLNITRKKPHFYAKKSIRVYYAGINYSKLNFCLKIGPKSILKIVNEAEYI